MISPQIATFFPKNNSLFSKTDINFSPMIEGVVFGNGHYSTLKNTVAKINFPSLVIPSTVA